MTKTMAVPEAIMTLRAELKLNRREELAVIVDVSSSAIAHWELGSKRPSRFHLFLMARLARERGLRSEIADAFEREAKVRMKGRGRRRKAAA